MTTWTEIDKSAQEVPELTLEIGSDFDLLIGDGYKLLIQEEIEGTEWTAQDETSTSWTATNKS